MKKRVLFTGGSGLLASSAWLTMADRWDMTFVVRSTETAPKDQKFILCPLEEEAKVRTLVETVRPELIVHAAGLTSVEECEKHKYRAHTSNVIATRHIAREARRVGSRLIHISTDHFAGESDLSTEGEIGFPRNNYALTKLEAEYEVTSLYPGALIARTNFFAWGLPHRRTFLDQIVENLRDNKEVGGFSDVSFNPLSGPQLLRYLDALDDKRAEGIYNVTGDELLSKYDFALKVAEAAGAKSSSLRSTKLADAATLVKRPFKLGLANHKMKATLGLKLTPSMLEMLKELAAAEADHKSRIRAAFQATPPAFISYGKQSILDADYEAVIAAVGNAYLTQGPKVEEFERRVADFVGAKYAVAMCNWTAGLHMAVLAAGVGPGDHVITSPITFVASSNCAVYAGATPHFADIDPVTLNLDPEKVDQLCQKLGKVKAIIPVHLAGAPCDMKRLKEVADKHGAMLIEDAAHAIGGSYLTGEKIGLPRYASMIGFSFHPVKNVTTGEGGLITTDDEKIYRHLLRLRSHGIAKGDDPLVLREQAYTKGVRNPWYYEMQELGFNFRITDLQCALGLAQLDRLSSMHARRVEIGQTYDKAFSELKNARLWQDQTRTKSGNHLYVLKVNYAGVGLTRMEVMLELRKLGVGSHVHYIPVYRQPFYKENYPVDLKDFPHAEAYYDSCLTLPMYPTMTAQDVERVIAGVRRVIG